MAIAVRQMVIKSTVRASEGPREEKGAAAVDVEQLKEALMSECRQMVRDLLRERRER